MPSVNYKILGQQSPAASTWVDLYVVPATREAIASSITVANRGTTLVYFRVAVCPAATALPANQDYLYYDVPLAGNDTFIATIGVTMEAANRVKVYSTGTTNISFQLFGSELIP